MMNYGGAPMVPTYDYGPSDRSLRSSNKSMDSRRSVSNRSVESNSSTLANTVINHGRTTKTKNNLRNSSYQLDNHKSSKTHQQRHSSEDDGEYANKGHEEHPTLTSNSPDYSTKSNADSMSPDQQRYQNRAHHYSSSAPYSPDDDASVDANNRSNATMASTIAVFGATTKTGQAIVRLALDAGYLVRALLGNSVKMQEQTNLEWVVGSLNDDKAIRDVVDQADFVVCTLAEHKFKKQKNLLREFVQRLYPIMKEQGTVKVFLFQSCSLATDLQGKTPVLSQIVKSVTKRGNQSLRDQDFIIQFISTQHNQDKENFSSDKPSFSFLITRPTVLIKDGPSIKKLAASKSQPGPFAITHIDLADFSLNALLDQKLYNKCPYVVADSGL